MPRIMVILGALLLTALLTVVLLAGGLLLYLTPVTRQEAAAQVAPQVVGAQAVQPIQSTGQPSITVVGDGSASTRPDQASLSVGVQVARPTAAEALAEANRATEAILAKVDELGIARANVQTSGISLFPIQEGGPKEGSGPPTITGYNAINQLTVLVSDLTKVGQVIDSVVAAGANQVSGVRFGLRDDSALRNQALQEAIKAARPRADALAAGLNLKTGEVLAIHEEGSFVPSPSLAVEQGRGGDTAVEPGQLMVRVRVQVTFALVP